jgi:hypothetical protein
MPCFLYLDVFFPEQFKTNPRSRLSKARDKELETIKKRGQQRRVVVSVYGEVVRSDIPLYEALLAAGYAAIAVVVVVGSPESVDIKAAKALSARNPLPWAVIGRMPPGAEYAMAFRKFTEDHRQQLQRDHRRSVNCLSESEQRHD